MTVLWAKKSVGRVDVPLVALGDRVVAGTRSGTLMAYDVKTGAVRWSAALGGSIAQAPRVSGGRVFATTAAGEGRASIVHCVAAGGDPGGRVLWRLAGSGVLAVSEARALVRTGDREVSAVALEGGKVLRSVTLDARVRALVRAPGTDRLVVGAVVGDRWVVFGLRCE